MKVVDVWTGRHATALRVALRMTNEEFGHHLGIAVRTVAKWNADPDLVPVSELQRALDTALSQATQDAKDRFALLTETAEQSGRGSTAVVPHALDAAVELRLNRDPAISDALHWLDRQAGWPSGEARRRVKDRLFTVEVDSLQDRAYRRGEVGREQVAEALATFYAPGMSQRHFYGVRCGSRVVTSVLTRPEWLDLKLPLGQGKDELAFSATAVPFDQRLDDIAAIGALSRLAEILALGTHFVNAPLYSLLSIDIFPERLNGLLGLTNFVERSGRVLNAARRLAVVPKAFHQPLVDLSEDTDISSTLEREMEEELFGRPELDATRGEQRRADPMHPDRLSEPMRWLLQRARPYSWRMECVGFGINAASGNYEFACLIVIDDEQWWQHFGGVIEGNWETEGLHRYSSLDRELLTGLVQDPAWSNEGLFAFLQSLRRLSEIGGTRVNLPAIELEGP